MFLKKSIIITLTLFILTFNVLPLMAETAEEWKTRGNEYLAQGDLDMALECYEKSLEVDPYYARSIHNTGIIYAKKKDYKKSLEYYSKALELIKNGKDTSGLPQEFTCEAMGWSYFYLEDYDRAMEALDKAMEANPEYAPACYTRGEIFYSQVKYEEALESYNKATELDPEHGGAWYGKGDIYYSQKKYEEALECYDKALEIMAEAFDIWNKKGLLLCDMGKYKEAIECYDKALEINPEFTGAGENKEKALKAMDEVKSPELLLECTVDNYTPKEGKEAKFTCSVINNTGKEITVDTTMSYDEFAFYGQGKEQNWPLHLWKYKEDKEEEAEGKKIIVKPGEKIVIFEAFLDEIFFDLEKWEDKPEEGLWLWDWIAHPKAPPSPIHVWQGEGLYGESALFWFTLNIDGKTLESNKLILKIK